MNRQGLTGSGVAPPIADVLAHRRWWFEEQPFPHFHATNVLTSDHYEALEAAVRQLLGRGLSDGVDSDRLSRNMPGADAFGWNLPPGCDGPLALFHDQQWHDMLAGLTGLRATGDVSCAVHHHRAGSGSGRIHRDLGVGWFPGAAPLPGGTGAGGVVNPADRSRCSYIYGDVEVPGTEVHEAVRAVTMIFYLANPPWSPGDGGETGLYRHSTDAVTSPAARVPPVNNSLVVFENTPWALHAFMANARSPRTSVILWLHRPIGEARRRFGEQALFRWRRPVAAGAAT